MSEGRWTEQRVLDVLERRFAKPGNGGSGEYAFLRQVRNDGGFKASRTFDAMAISLWPSRGYEVHVFEVKVSKSDWRRELKDGAKAEAACQIADRFSVVAPKGVVDRNEVPPTWGYIEVSERQARTILGAPTLRKGGREQFPAGLVISMLRSAGAVPGRETPAEAALRSEYERGLAEAEERWVEQVARARRDHQELSRQVEKFARASGVRPIPGAYGPAQEEVLASARRIREALADETHLARVRSQVSSLADRLQDAATGLRGLLTEGRDG